MSYFEYDIKSCVKLCEYREQYADGANTEPTDVYSYQCDYGSFLEIEQKLEGLTEVMYFPSYL